MTHLKIIQNNTLADTEEVSQEIVQKLYDQAVSGDLDASSEMKGRLHLTAGYRTQTEYLHQMFPNLIISADTYIIPFEDSNMVAYLNSIGIGNNGMVTETQAAAAYMVANSQNTSITKFNELKYFTNITESRGGFEDSSNSSGWVRFREWTALEEIDLSNFTSIGHTHWNICDDSFYGCTNLKKVIASDKLNKFGKHVFQNCSNLEDITGLSGTINVYGHAFNGCEKLKDSTFSNTIINLLDGDNHFLACKLIKNIVLGTGTTYIPSNAFSQSGIETITIPSTVTRIDVTAFYGCTALQSIDLSNITTIKGWGIFYNCSSLVQDLYIPNLTSLTGERIFDSSGITSITSLGSVTTIPSQFCFNCTNLTSVSGIPNVTTIQSKAFQGCTSLTSIDLSSVTTIDTNAFTGCTSLSGELDMPLLTAMGTYCFQGCGNITKVKCLGKLSAIPQAIFTKYPASSMALSEVYLPYECTKIGIDAFQDCANLTTIKQYNKSIDQYVEGESPVFTDIGARITSIDQGAFRGTGLSGNLSFPNLTYLGGGRVLGTHITSVDFTGSTFTTVDQDTFNMCLDLDHVIFPDTVTNVKKNSFYNCQNLSYIVFPTTSTITWEANRDYFTNVPSSCIMYVADSKVSEVTTALSGKFKGQIKGISEMPSA